MRVCVHPRATRDSDLARFLALSTLPCSRTSRCLPSISRARLTWARPLIPTSMPRYPNSQTWPTTCASTHSQVLVWICDSIPCPQRLPRHPNSPRAPASFHKDLTARLWRHPATTLHTVARFCRPWLVQTTTAKLQSLRFLLADPRNHLLSSSHPQWV